ncbi:MAG: hypothetical protein A2677_00410 [Candidatus Komeilibacteria bacterium RIFCSPHIGHO2_01_FULL_52_14]|uniref:RNA polymerase sigma factor SigW n=1 Tax=Candidatus Komeilibacteria bacterium RIFCSPHIGHO2_01_FULL_52_14 TaxID=1798549 RepID=A0A1G2BLY7_9BACT|nr:MAG: hypothetical protein A2677_00410 [Candidatus Komeilibacteria bacterium RIFCSPHIGHO2_01_FULL_52_14]
MADKGDASDEAIVLQVQKGDLQAFGALVERYERKLLRYARKFLLQEEDRKDLVQEIFIKAYTNIKSFDIHRKFSPWIYRIAHNEFVNAGKRKWRDTMHLVDFDVVLPHPAAKETADADVNRNDLRAILDRCLAQIDAKYREPLVLYYYEELGYKEIAEALQIPVATVGVRLQRGKAILQKLITRHDPSYGKR